MGKSESRGSNESVLPATSRGVVHERRSVFSLKTENILSSRCNSGREIEKSGGALSPMEGTTMEGLRKRVVVLNREIGKMKAYGDEINDSIQVTSPKTECPKQEHSTGKGSSATCMARPDQYRGARTHRQEARAGESRDIGKAYVEGLEWLMRGTRGKGG